MSIKENYLKLSEKFGGPYTLMKKGIKRSLITSIMEGKDVRISNVIQIALALGVSVEELIGAEKPDGEAAKIPLVEHNNEEVKYIDKLLSVLRGHDEAKKSTVKGVLDMAKQDAWTQEQRAAYKKTAP